MTSESLIAAIAVTSELLGANLSEPAQRQFAADLSGYPEAQIVAALKRCRFELKGRLTIAEIVSRIDDGRPGPDEAYANLPHDEAVTVVWTTEASRAWEASRHAETEIARRQAFRERYIAEVAAARSRGEPPRWLVSEGWDPAGRAAVIEAAIAAGRLPATEAPRRLETGRPFAVPKVGSRAG